MPEIPIGQVEGVLLTIWRSEETGYVECRMVEFRGADERQETVWEDAGPFDVPEAVGLYQNGLRSLKLL